MIMKRFRQITGVFLATMMALAASVPAFATDNTVVESRETIGFYTYGLNGHFEDSYTGGSSECYAQGDHYSVIYYDFQNTGTPPAVLEQLHGIPVTCIRALYRKPSYAPGVAAVPAIPKLATDISHAYMQSTFAVPPTIPDGVKNMAFSFTSNTSLSYFPQLPAEAEIISGAFSGCSSASGTPVLPPTITDMDAAYKQCYRLTQFPDISGLDNLKSAEMAFANCANAVGGTDLPDSGLKSISYLFGDCTKMTTPPRVIYESVTNISNAFARCANLSGTIDVRATLGVDKQGNYRDAFTGAVTADGAELTLNYTAQNEAVIDEIIAKKTAINHIQKGVLLGDVLPPEPTPDPDPMPDPDPNPDDGVGLPVPDGSASQDVVIRGVVEPINTIDVDIPLNLTFTINENRHIFYTKNAKITSNSPAPLVVSSLGVTIPANAPKLVPDDTFPDWDRLTMAQTKNNLAVSINGANLSVAGVKLGDLDSGYGTPAELPLDLSVLYGKLWPNTTLLTFDYIMDLQLALAE